MLPVAMSSSLKSSIGSSASKHTCSAKPRITVGVHGFGCWASVQLSLQNDSNSCSTSAELCITVGRGDETDVVISQSDHFPQTPFNTIPRQRITINSITVQRQKQNSVGFLGQNGLSLPVYCNVDSARSAPINDSFESSLYSDGKSPKSSS